MEDKNCDEAAAGRKGGIKEHWVWLAGCRGESIVVIRRQTERRRRWISQSEARRATELEKEAMAQAPMPGNFYIAREHLTKYGNSQDCLGCKSFLLETTQQAHNSACGSRFERDATEKQNEFLA